MYENPNEFVHIPIPEGFTEDQVRAKVGANGSVIIEWDPKLVAVATYKAWTALRAERDAKLKNTDQSVDMRIYRQALRDLPSNTIDPYNPVWPKRRSISM